MSIFRVERWHQARMLTVGAVGAALTVATALAHGHATAAPADGTTLMMSSRSDRGGAVELTGQAVSGRVAIFLSSSGSVREVRFHLDDPNRLREPIQIERGAPWDFRGGDNGLANLFDTTALGDGPHNVSAFVVFTDGSTTVVNRTAVVANHSPSGQPAPRGDVPGWRQVFVDDFTGSALGPGWGAYEGPIPSTPGGVWRRSHVTVEDGKLRLLGHQEGTDWVTGGVMNFVQAKTTYGKYEVRFRMDRGNGVKYAILTWPETNVWPADGEIDFAEDGGGARTGTAATVHYDENGHRIIQRTTAGDFSVWHTVGVEWTPGRLVYTLDGRPWATVDTPHTPSKPMNLAIQTEAAKTCTQWVTCIDPTTPAHVDLEVDWVAVYVRQ